MIRNEVRERFERYLCCCVQEEISSDVKDDPFLCIPRKFGKFIILYGKKRSIFPFHCMVGPDWIFIVFVILLIIVINGLVLGIISPLGWPPVFIGGLSAFFLLYTYLFVAFSDPGIVFKDDFPIDIELGQKSDTDTKNEENPNLLKNNDNHESHLIPSNRSSIPSRQRIPQTIECSKCEMQRPYTARHCDYCGVCIEGLDHHCPWSGKCIGEKVEFAFNLFLSILCFQFYFLLGTLIYFFIFKFGKGAPGGPGF